jgi:dTDP-4-dehydrorhamnose reductase
MKVLILGADGMIGHKMAQKFYKPGFELYLNTRSKKDFLKKIFPKAKTIQNNLLVSDILKILNKISPDYILNCCGITIRRGINLNRSNSIKINSELPYLISDWTRKKSSKLIQFSTDCVFNGKKGFYNDYSIPDAKDLYGSTKAKSEIGIKNTLTLRSSMIGREIFNKTELLEWLISNKNKVINGFSNVIYSGITTLEMSKYVYDIIDKNISISGIYNVSSKPISKFDLLKKLNKKFNLNIKIINDNSFSSDKTLNSQAFFAKTGLKTPSWDLMLEELFLDSIKFNDIYKKI